MFLIFLLQTVWQAFNHDEVQVDIASYKEGDSVYYAEVEAAGGKMFFLPGIKNLPEHVKVCNKILSDGRYDIIHDNTLHGATWATATF